MEVKSANAPDETRTFEKGKLELVKVVLVMVISHNTYIFLPYGLNSQTTCDPCNHK